MNDLTKLSRKHRLYGFLVCWLLGMLLTALSVLGIPALLLGNPESFALPYSMGAQEREPTASMTLCLAWCPRALCWCTTFDWY